MVRRGLLGLVVGVIALATLLSACSGGGTTSTSSPSASPSASATPTVDPAITQCQTDVNALVGIAASEETGIATFDSSKKSNADAQALVTSTQKLVTQTKNYQAGSLAEPTRQTLITALSNIVAGYQKEIAATNQAQLNAGAALAKKGSDAVGQVQASAGAACS